MKSNLPALLLLLALGGCDNRHYAYEVHYQEYARATLGEDGARVFLTARAAFADARPSPGSSAGSEPGGRGMTPDERFRYIAAHPEIYGPITSRAEFEEQFGESGGAGPSALSTVEVVIAGEYDAAFTVVADGAVLSRGGDSWRARGVDRDSLRVGARAANGSYRDEGAAVTITFPSLPDVAAVAGSLTPRQIAAMPAPATDPIELTLTLESNGRTRTVRLTFERVAEHEPFAPNPFFRLYSAR